MRKDELVHFHSLLSLVRAEFERRGAPPEAFAAYDDLDVSPMAVYGSKDEHERAVRTLARALAAVADDADGHGGPDGQSAAGTDEQSTAPPDGSAVTEQNDQSAAATSQ